jgi:hypothetical protein
MSGDAPRGDKSTGQATGTPAPALPEGERLLWTGDRVPDFVLPDPEGRLRFFYQTVTGKPLVLAMAANTAMQEQWDEIKGFAAQAAALRTAGAELMIVSNDGVESLSMVSKFIPEHALWLADIKGVVNFGLRTGALLPFSGVVCMVLDANQRIVAIRGPEPGQADWALSVLTARPAEPARRLGVVAPVLLLPGVLDEQDRQELAASIPADGTSSGSAPLGEGALAQKIGKLLLRRIGPEVEKAFAFDDFAFESLTLHWHGAAPSAASDLRREIVDPAVEGRSFVLILDLSEEKYEGGEILFPEYGPHSYEPGAGGALVYSGTMLRELKPVAAGRRILLTAVLRRAAKTAAPSPMTAG